MAQDLSLVVLILAPWGGSSLFWWNNVEVRNHKPKKRTGEEARPLRKEARGPNGISLIALEDTDSSLSVTSENSLACDEGTTSVFPQLPSVTWFSHRLNYLQWSLLIKRQARNVFEKGKKNRRWDGLAGKVLCADDARAAAELFASRR